MHRNLVSAPRSLRGFTLIEVLIVVVILGVLAAIVIPQFTSASDDAKRTSFITNVRSFTQQAMRYQLDNGEYPADGASGVIPAGFEAYVQETIWENGTPIGGVWDAERDSFGVSSAVGVHFDGTGDTRDDAYMVVIDTEIDDGDLETGSFQHIAANRYYMIVED